MEVKITYSSGRATEVADLPDGTDVHQFMHSPYKGEMSRYMLGGQAEVAIQPAIQPVEVPPPVVMVEQPTPKRTAAKRVLAI
jgi:hypothetical protein